MHDIRIWVRPILAVGCLCALIWFYTLMVFGNDIPPGVNGFWAPISWWFVERTRQKIKEEKDGK